MRLSRKKRIAHCTSPMEMGLKNLRLHILIHHTSFFSFYRNGGSLVNKKNTQFFDELGVL